MSSRWTCIAGIGTESACSARFSPAGSVFYGAQQILARSRSGEPDSRFGCLTVSLSVDMKPRTNLPWAMRLYQTLMGRLARRLCLALLLLVLVFSTVVRIGSVVLTRRIHAVLSGLEQIRVDQTPEVQLLKSVPYLVREGDYPRGGFVERYYRVGISNEDSRKWLWNLAGTRPIQLLWPSPQLESAKEPMDFVSFPVKLAHWLGWRYVGFNAWAVVKNGRVSNVGYGIETDIEQGWPHDPFVFARSFHGFWMEHALPVPVSDTDDESPTYRVKGTERVLGAEYSPDAPMELIRHAFQVDLSCYWSIRGCVSTRELAPFLWRDKQAIDARATARLHGTGNPCPDSVLAGRVRYLPDLNVELLEVVDYNNGAAGEPSTRRYQLRDLIWGRPDRARASAQQPASTAPPPDSPSLNVGDRVLAFTGAKFDSCQVVPATPSAVSAVRSAVPAQRWREDAVSMGGRM